jgi:nucleoside-diphosphate-sugar epimerase
LSAEDIVPSAGAPGTLAVTGANGFIGSHLVALAQAHGVPVRTLTRRRDAAPAAVAMEQRFVGRLPDDVPPEFLAGVDAVVHCAAWVGGDGASAAPVNVDGTLRLAALAEQAGVRAFVFLSTQSAVADARSDYGRTKYAAQETLRARFAASPLAVVVVRLGLVTGAGTHGVYPRLARLARRWPVVPLVGGDAVVQPIHVDDVCRALLRCARDASALRGRVLQLGAPERRTLADFVGVVAEAQSGRRKPLLAVPRAPLLVAARAAERAGLRFPVTSQNLEGVARVPVMDTRADLERLGVPDRPLAEIVRDDLAVESALAREAARLGRYLVGRRPAPPLVARYARAVATLGLAIAPDEARGWRLAIAVPAALRFVDGGLALAKPEGTIRRRVHMMLAILEASPDHCDAFLPAAARPRDWLLVGLAALRAGVAGAVGLVLVRLLGVERR